MAPLNILIIGNSIGGPTLATFLLLSSLPPTQKPHVTVLERSANVRAQGQNIDIRGGGLTIIRKLGLETQVRRSTTGEEGVEFVDEKNQVWARFGADRTGKTSTPTADIEIMRGRLAELCYERCKSVSEEVQSQGGKGVEFVFGDTLDLIEQDGQGVDVRFKKSGERRRFDLVVGADGLQSSTRRMVWGEEGEEERVKRLGMFAAFFSMPVAKTDTMWRRWYHIAGRRGIMLRPNVSGNNTTCFMAVVNENDKRLVDVAKRSAEGVELQKNLMAEYFRGTGWESQRVVDEMMTTKDFYYDLVGQVKMDKWSKGRVVLLGDAGYCASPISGMGTTLALNGAYNLAGAILQHPDDFTTAFAQYEEKMRPIVDKAQKLAPGQPWLMWPETTWGVWALNRTMFCLDWSGLIPLALRFFGPRENAIPVEDYGFRQLADWQH